MRNKDLSIVITFDPCQFSLDSTFKLQVLTRKKRLNSENDSAFFCYSSFEKSIVEKLGELNVFFCSFFTV
jgi:ABC-type antimicrobial peptide transport system ATPase subunit